MDRYLGVRLRSSGKARIGLGEYPGGTSVKGTYGTLLRGMKTTRSFLSPEEISHYLFSFLRHTVVASTRL
jgi:hypothetical protein